MKNLAYFLRLFFMKKRNLFPILVCQKKKKKKLFICLLRKWTVTASPVQIFLLSTTFNMVVLGSETNAQPGVQVLTYLLHSKEYDNTRIILQRFTD